MGLDPLICGIWCWLQVDNARIELSYWTLIEEVVLEKKYHVLGAQKKIKKNTYITFYNCKT